MATKVHEMTVAYNKLRYQVEAIGPTEAATMLAQGSINRRLSAFRVEQLATTMSEGRWDENEGSPIRFNTQNELIDGQHRLSAVIRSGKEFLFLVLRDVPMDTMMVMDTGKSRTTGDFFGIRGVKNANTIAAVTNLLWVYKNHGILTTHGGGGHLRVSTTPELTEFLRTNPGISESATVGDAVRRNFNTGGSIWAAAHYILTQIDAEDTQDFFEKLYSGAELTSGHAILALRRRVTERIKERPLGQGELSALIFKAWNLYRDGKSIMRLRWSRGGVNAETYPVPR